MLYNDQRGFAVMNRSLTAYSFESENLKDCKRFCTKEDVIVERIPVVCGFNLRVWISDYRNKKLFEWDKYSRRLIIGKLNMQFGKEFKHKFGKTVYDPQKEKDYQDK